MAEKESSKNRLLPLTSEEEDLLERDKKKVKNVGEGFSGLSSSPISYADLDDLRADEGNQADQPRSYKDSLTGSKSGGIEDITEVLEADGFRDGNAPPERTCSDEDMPPLEDATPLLADRIEEKGDEAQGFSFIEDPDEKQSGLIVSISQQERERMGIPLKRTLIIKLLGKSVGFNFLEKRLNQLWARKGVISIVDFENDYYLVKFSAIEDYNFALLEGPWVIFDHYLTVRRWFSGFDPCSDVINRVAVWVRFPKLPFDCYDEKFLWSFGNKIGKTVKIDTTTIQQSRGKFARVCIEIDISKPLISKFKLDGKQFFLEYESIHLICFECGCYGHSTEKCPSKIVVNQTEPADDKIPEAQHENSKYGDWMIVKKTRRPRRKSTDDKTNKIIGKGKKDDTSKEVNLALESRYAALEGDDLFEDNIEDESSMDGNQSSNAKSPSLNEASNDLEAQQRKEIVNIQNSDSNAHKAHFEVTHTRPISDPIPNPLFRGPGRAALGRYGRMGGRGMPYGPSRPPDSSREPQHEEDPLTYVPKLMGESGNNVPDAEMEDVSKST